MRLYGIIGRPLGHSFSKGYFDDKFAHLGLSGEYRYCNFPLENIGELPGLIAAYPDLCGFNVTIPYKKEVMALLDEVSDEARAIGAVNCVKITGGRLTGYNTDVRGFRAGLEKLLGGTLVPRALILGSGGAAAAVRYALERENIEYQTVARGDYGANFKLSIINYRLIINTTPLGTFPNVDEKPDIPYEALGAGHFLYDLVYNPPVTAFLAEGARRGAAALNGLDMLRAQAEENWKIWTNL